MISIYPSLLSANFANLEADIRQVEDAGIEWLHLDVMDGRFVPNITVGPVVIRAIRKITSLRFDAHLMVAEPERYIEDFRKAGAENITVHAEACTHLHRVVHQVKDTGAEVGVALNPASPLSFVQHVLPDVDLVLLMTVNPGFGGQSFISSVLGKIRDLRAQIDAAGKPMRLQVDGGVGPRTAPQVTAAGADSLVAGSAVFGKGSIAGNIKDIRASFE